MKCLWFLDVNVYFEKAKYEVKENVGIVELKIIFSEVIPFKSYLKFEVEGHNGKSGPFAESK